jgi:acetate kinase
MHWLAAQRPDLEQWACFDTAFHATLPPEAATYAIPADWRRQSLRRFGFHGLSHQHVAEEVAERFPPAAAAPPLRLCRPRLTAASAAPRPLVGGAGPGPQWKKRLAGSL